MEASDGLLPPTYKACDYLQTSGFDARIDTGIPGNNDALVFDFDFATITRQAYAGAFGNYTNDNTRCWRMLNPSGTGDSRMYHTNAFNAKGSSTITSYAVPTDDSIIGARINFHISSGRVETKYGSYTSVGTKEADGTTAISIMNICIGAPNPTRTGGSLVGRFWHFKIWDGSVLVRNYIPCVRKRDNKAGFYDLANHSFNPSIGTVDFIAGYDT